MPPCSNCGGFRAVAITTGQRLPDTSRETTVVHCAAHHPDQPGNTPVLYRIPDAALLLNLSRSVVYDLMRTGRLRTVSEGRSRRIPASAIHEYVALLEREAEACDAPAPH
jgi:excisionase family DNA binding protein